MLPERRSAGAKLTWVRTPRSSISIDPPVARPIDRAAPSHAIRNWPCASAAVSVKLGCAGFSSQNPKAAPASTIRLAAYHFHDAATLRIGGYGSESHGGLD